MLEKVEEFNMDKVIQEFELLTRDAKRVQRETLKRILEDNTSAEYLQSLGLNGRTDPESFKACVPMVTHKELEPYSCCLRIQQHQRKKGLLPPLDAPHHLRKHEWGPYREVLLEMFDDCLWWTAWVGRDY
ncbi:Jasmonic acid-amido synthetase JAR1 [Glycine soja]|uniref:Jasmonic acid-amido synthetase JAR1 isoform A n=1 Tax=Glycine soja TaxID=3848 RepID=A0A445F5Z9_GLYSO|nr:jasmonoyl--L-amino acid synthetase JAR6-like [Glycine soja]XP_028220837.1 jasmonoyl--L-amino acid synthetase JAR6-like [Glycine soja]XP_028220838.1 jasmonoyl--L-amino acid synthetase JAR6-like [Glycine soja]KAG5053027.1 hypothetical protein JHK87_005225 [Glycine soja]RZB44264.1 Jasmonic acid-amido synthetase JAR1 isoform A [Glycine soja]RZB44265.1 Jasmonic acid-amido synthetase JAR1 isoform B [Glycine soja]